MSEPSSFKLSISPDLKGPVGPTGPTGPAGPSGSGGQPYNFIVTSNSEVIPTNTFIIFTGTSSSKNVEIAGPYEIGDKIFIKNLMTGGPTSFTIIPLIGQIENLESGDPQFVSQTTVSLGPISGMEFTYAPIGSADTGFILTCVIPV